MDLTPEIIKRLSFIKYFYEFAREQSKLPPPQNYISVLMFHDSIELFLNLSAEFLKVNKKDPNFMEYFTEINKKLNNQELTQKISMDKLNKVRVLLKHKGLYPNPNDVEHFRVNTQNFLEENCSIIFGIKFIDISLLDLVQDEEVKNILEDAQNEFKSGEYKKSLEYISIAFYVLLKNYEENKKVYGRSPFDIGGDLRFIGSLSWDYDSKISDVGSMLKVIQKVLKIILLNLDYRKFIKFRLLTSDCIYKGKEFYDKYSIQWFGGRDKAEFKKEDVEYCISFIIEYALKLQEFDFEMGEHKLPYSFLFEF